MLSAGQPAGEPLHPRLGPDEGGGGPARWAPGVPLPPEPSWESVSSAGAAQGLWKALPSEGPSPAKQWDHVGPTEPSRLGGGRSQDMAWAGALSGLPGGEPGQEVSRDPHWPSADTARGPARQKPWTDWGRRSGPHVGARAGAEVTPPVQGVPWGGEGRGRAQDSAAHLHSAHSVQRRRPGAGQEPGGWASWSPRLGSDPPLAALRGGSPGRAGGSGSTEPLPGLRAVWGVAHPAPSLPCSLRSRSRNPQAPRTLEPRPSMSWTGRGDAGCPRRPHMRPIPRLSERDRNYC